MFLTTRYEDVTTYSYYTCALLAEATKPHPQTSPSPHPQPTPTHAPTSPSRPSHIHATPESMPYPSPVLPLPCPVSCQPPHCQHPAPLPSIRDPAPGQATRHFFLLHGRTNSVPLSAVALIYVSFPSFCSSLAAYPLESARPTPSALMILQRRAPAHLERWCDRFGLCGAANRCTAKSDGRIGGPAGCHMP